MTRDLPDDSSQAPKMAAETVTTSSCVSRSICLCIGKSYPPLEGVDLAGQNVTAVRGLDYAAYPLTCWLADASGAVL